MCIAVALKYRDFWYFEGRPNSLAGLALAIGRTLQLAQIGDAGA
jgi:hypothetical protein